MAEHVVVKPAKIAAAAANLLESNLIVPAVFQREGLDAYKGSANDTINVKVEGVLPYRTYGWRSDRSTTVQFDTYSERTVAVQFGGDIYSAVRLTDEQNLMDLDGWGKLAAKQTEAIGRGLEWQATQYLNGAPYEVTLKLDSTNLRKSLIRARNVMNKLKVTGPRTMLIGTDIEAALLDNDALSFGKDQGTGDAGSALKEATLGNRYGFNFVVAQELDPKTAVAMVPSAFIFTTGAPTVPQSVPFGATASANGVAVRWIRDYDSERFQDRSIFNTYKGFRNVVDDLVGVDSGTGQAFVSTTEHFVRAIKLSLDGTDVLPPATAGTAKEAELRALTGIAVGKV